MNSRELLKFQAEIGADEAIEASPQARVLKTETSAAKPSGFSEPAAQIYQPQQAKPLANTANAIAEARKLADTAKTRDALEQAVRNFDGCNLKKTATNTVFCDGQKDAKIMLIGEAPGANEDEQGIPFCGQSGKLLDAILASIGISRAKNLYITNTLFWRPPGNRRPTPEELEICKPFVEKHIALMQPELLILAGGTAVAGVLESKESVSGLRKRYHSYRNAYMQKEVPVAVIFHPSYLLRSPGQKKLAWADMLKMKKFLKERSLL